MDAVMPKFMENNDWYYYDYSSGKYVLTANAPKEAIESYDEFYKKRDAMAEDVDEWAKKHSKR